MVVVRTVDVHHLSKLVPREQEDKPTGYFLVRVVGLDGRHIDIIGDVLLARVLESPHREWRVVPNEIVDLAGVDRERFQPVTRLQTEDADAFNLEMSEQVSKGHANDGFLTNCSVDPGAHFCRRHAFQWSTQRVAPLTEVRVALVHFQDGVDEQGVRAIDDSTTGGSDDFHAAELLEWGVSRIQEGFELGAQRGCRCITCRYDGCAAAALDFRIQLRFERGEAGEPLVEREDVVGLLG